MKHVRITLVALAALFGAMLVSHVASAMPVSGLKAAVSVPTHSDQLFRLIPISCSD